MTSISEQSDSKSSKALPENILPSSKTQHDEDVKTDLACLAMDITEIVTGLLKLSVAILQPTFRNRTQKLAAIDVSQFESVDIQDMFPKAPMYLVRRLDRANTKRRQILTYCQKSHEKARKCINVDVTALPAPILEQHEEPRTIDQPVDIVSFHIQKDTRAAKTTVSTDRQPTPDIPEATSDTSQSETSSTTSVDSSRHKFKVPLLSSSELAFKRHQFECPYCFRIIVVHDKDSWR